MLIILDRDGVVNEESVAYIKNPDEWIPIPGSLEAITRLTKAGHRIVIMTNQAGVGRGLYDEAMLHTIHQKLHHELSLLGGVIDHVYYCPHHPDDQCPCRKPETGMLEAIERDFPEDWPHRLVIGDSLRDIQAAHATDTEGWLVLTGFGMETKEDPLFPVNTPVFNNLEAAVNTLLSC